MILSLPKPLVVLEKSQGLALTLQRFSSEIFAKYPLSGLDPNLYLFLVIHIKIKRHLLLQSR